MSSSSPQAREMADESMVRNLAAQAEAIWPQEEPIFERHPPGSGAVLDVGCGTGEIPARLADKFPHPSFTGVDLEGAHLARARVRCSSFGSRVRFETGDALALSFAAATFDLVVCRHLIQAVPDAAHVLAEIRRVLRPEGRIHLIAEDYGMLHCYPTELDSDDFWQRIPRIYGPAIGCEPSHRTKDVHASPRPRDDRHPRRLHRRRYVARTARYVCPDLGSYTDAIVEHSGIPLWQVPVWTAVKT